MKSRIMFTLVLGVLSASATAPASASSTHFHSTFAFTLTGGPSPLCPLLPTGFVINGSGDETVIVNTSVNSSGAMHVEIHDLDIGRATDSNGASYVVNHHFDEIAAIQAGGFPTTLLFPDHFNLVGNGLATQLQMHSVIRVTFISSSDPGTVQIVNAHGDPFDCEPNF